MTPTVSDVTGLVARAPGARMGRHVIPTIPVPADATNGLVYPDPRARLRMGAEPGALPGRPAAPASGRPYETPVVAIVDSGIMVDHPDLRDHLWPGPNGIHGKQFIDGKTEDDVTDEDGHGTALAGTVVSAAGDTPGILHLMAAKFFDATTPPRPENAARAIDFAFRHGASIVLLSWDVGLGSDALGKAIRQACDAGALIVIAAGNNGSDNDRLPWVPACYASECPGRVITVMATDPYDNEKASSSNYGRQSVDLAAPGVRIVSTRRLLSKASAAGSGKYRRYSGTSQAAAYVAGAAALLKSQYPKLFAEGLKSCLVGKDSVDAVPPLKCASQGRLNIKKALECATKEYERLGLAVSSP